MPIVRRLFRGLALVLTLLVPISIPAKPPCQPQYLEGARSLDAWSRYRERTNGKRCEGYYSSKVSNKLEVVGLLQRPLRFDPDGVALTLASAVPDRPIAIVGRLIPSRRYWRLDAELAANAGLRWPTGLLTQQRFRADQVGLFGRLADQPGDWLVPIDVRGGPPTPATPRLLLRAPVALSQVQWRAVGAPGFRCGAYEEDWRTVLRKGAPRSYGAGAAVRIPLPGPDLGSALCIEIQADPRGRAGPPLRTEVRILR